MLTNAKVGTKLLALVIAPVMVLLAVASFGARDRLDEAAEAERVEDVAQVTALTDAAARSLGLERLLTAASIEDGGSEQLDDARRDTDAALEAMRPSVTSGSLAGFEDRVNEVVERLADVEDLRDSVDRGDVDILVAIDTYSLAIDELIRLAGELASSTSVAELSLALSNANVLTRAIEARSQLAALGADAIAVGDFIAGDLEAYADLRDEEERLLAQFTDDAPARSVTDLRNALASPEAVAADAQVDDLISDATMGGAGSAQVSMQSWVDGQRAWLGAVGAVDEALVDDVMVTAADREFTATKAARLFMIATAGATLLSILFAVWLARSIDRPLRRLTVAADDLATDRLPRLVENLRTGDGEDAELETFEPLEVTSGDEIGQVTEAFNAIQQVTVNVAEEQSTLLRKGIGDIFVNLARRNQSLLDRQIEFIDELESKEQDPDLLENLFRLDHLATRMRRNAESLLVLAGAEPARRRAQPVGLLDVVRVAIGEVEDFTRVQLVDVDDAVVAGNLAVDLAHLLSELMENATHFSPPETSVEVAGQFGSEGTYVLTVADHGIGMSGEDLEEANALLADPPLVGLALGRSLGFIVVGRIAVRLGLRVHLDASPAGGVTAVISLPADLVARPDEPEPRDPLLDRGPAPPVPAVEPRAEPEPRAELETAFEPMLLDIDDEEDSEDEDEDDRANRLADALPEGDDFEEGLALLIGPDESDEDLKHQFWGSLADEDGDEPEPTEVEVPEPALVDLDVPEPAEVEVPEPALVDLDVPEPAEVEVPEPALVDLDVPEPAEVEVPEPALVDLDEPEPAEVKGPEAPPAPPAPTGLTRRVPGAAAATVAPVSAPTIDAPRRSPEEVRAMLSRYRDGLKGGQDPDASRPDSTTEGSDD